MKIFLISILSTLCFELAVAQTGPAGPSDYRKYFKQLKSVAKKNKSLWNRNLYGPILLIEPGSRKIYANEPDKEGFLSVEDGVFTGNFPENLNMANSSIDWAGVRWAMIMLPLSADEKERKNLLSHELFHSVQTALGFSMANPENNHLDSEIGRAYLRLELAALKQAVIEHSLEVALSHIKNALLFRVYRQDVFEGSRESENALELNEGIAEYTGFSLSGRSKTESRAHFIHQLSLFEDNPSFVRSFAYQTIPIYGKFLNEINVKWNLQVNGETDLTELFLTSFGQKIPVNLNDQVVSLATLYQGDLIFKEEADREYARQQRISSFKQLLHLQPHVEISLSNMSISFDPRNIFPMEDLGTVYPDIRITDDWGILMVENSGLLMNPSWNRVSISFPLQEDGKNISGEGWTLQLNEGFQLIKNEETGNFEVMRTNAN